MTNFILRVVINGLAIVLTSMVLPGMETRQGIGTVLILGVVFGVVNGLIRPIVKALTCPLIILTLGLFVLVINGGMLLLTAWLVPDRLFIAGWGTAILAGIVMGVINVILEAITGINRKED